MGDPDFPGRGYSLVPRNKYLAVVAFAALCLSIVGLADASRLPAGSSLGGAVSSGSLFSMDVLTSFLDIGYAGLFLLMAMESTAFPVPSELVLPFAGYLVFLDKMNLGLAVADATAAGLVGSLVAYYLGLKLGRPVVYGLLVRAGVPASHLDEGERWVDSKGAWSVFVGRFIPGVRSVISIPAGVLRMKLWPFVILTTVGSFVWSALLVYLGYSAGSLWRSSLDSLSAFADQAALVLVAVLSVLYVGYYLASPRHSG